MQSQFGANAANYATSHVHAKGACLARLVELTAPLRQWPALDIANGAWHTAAAFAPHIARVLATDITPEMLDEARKLASSKGLATTTTAVADAEALAFGAQSFDLVTCRIAPHHFSSVAKFVSEVHRMLQPGARLHSSTTSRRTHRRRRDFPMPISPRPQPLTMHSKKTRDRSHVRALTTAEWLTLVAGAGLKVCHHEHQPKAMDFAAWCGTMNVPDAARLDLQVTLSQASPAFARFSSPAKQANASAWFSPN